MLLLNKYESTIGRNSYLKSFSYTLSLYITIKLGIVGVKLSRLAC